jgi:serine protease Do
LIKFGRTKRGWLGVRIQGVTEEIAESLGLGKARGAIVGGVTPDGPAAKAKIEQEDIILEFDGKEVSEKAKLNRLVGETPVGKSVKVKVWRKGKEMTFDVVLGEFETAPDRVSSAGEQAKSAVGQEIIEVLGIKLSALTPELRERFKLSKEVKGIMVMKVDINSTAVEIGLKGVERDRAGDIIEKVNQKELSNPEEFAKAIEEAKKENRKNILLLVTRDGEPRFVPLKLENEDLTDSAKNKDKEKDKK